LNEQLALRENHHLPAIVKPLYTNEQRKISRGKMLTSQQPCWLWPTWLSIV